MLLNVWQKMNMQNSKIQNMSIAHINHAMDQILAIKDPNKKNSRLQKEKIVA